MKTMTVELSYRESVVLIGSMQALLEVMLKMCVTLPPEYPEIKMLTDRLFLEGKAAFPESDGK